MDDAMREAREWVMVPREPTETMLHEGFTAGAYCQDVEVPFIWSAMLAAAPQPNPTERANLVGEGEAERFSNPLVERIDGDIYIVFDAPNHSIAPFVMDEGQACALHAALSITLAQPSQAGLPDREVMQRGADALRYVLNFADEAKQVRTVMQTFTLPDRVTTKDRLEALHDAILASLRLQGGKDADAS